MSVPIYIVDHVQRAQAFLASVMFGSPILELLVQLFAEEAQRFEDLAHSLWAERLLSSAQGAQLDQYGELAGVSREGMLDDEYRRIIRVRRYAYRSKGTPEEIMHAAAILFGDGEDDALVRYYPLYPAAYGVEVKRAGASSSTVRTRALEILHEMTPHGVLLAEVIEVTPGNFGFLGDSDALGYDEGGYSELLT